MTFVPAVYRLFKTDPAGFVTGAGEIINAEDETQAIHLATVRCVGEDCNLSLWADDQLIKTFLIDNPSFTSAADYLEQLAKPI
ncbi:MAG: hypothetical protein J0I16_26470 [Rhizobiales bacterium]|nr:hypothetical protein [Hyphomicrobiales bacterium]